jgi:hypothetical protein
MTRVDPGCFHLRLRCMEMKQLQSLGSYPAQSERAVKVLVHTKSIPETARVTHVSSAFRACAPSATSSSDAATDRQLNERDRRAGRATLLDRALQAHDEWSRFSISFSAMTRRGARTSSAARRAEKVNGRDGLNGDRIQTPVVFGRNRIILSSQLQLLLILSLATRPVYPGGPLPFQGSWR